MSFYVLWHLITSMLCLLGVLAVTLFHFLPCIWACLPVLQYGNHVWLVNTTGIINTIIGSGSTTASFPEGDLATTAGIPTPRSVAVDSKGTIYVTDRTTVRKVTCPDQM